MYLLKKSAANLLKNKGRNVVIFLILTIVTTSALIGLSVFNTTGKIVRETENYYLGEVTINKKNPANQDDKPAVSAADYEKYANSAYLKSYVIYKSMPVFVNGLSLFDEEYLTEENPGANKKISKSNSRVFGLLDEKSSDDFSYGERVITSGAFPQNSSECMISENLAERNSLKVGDSISLTVGLEQSEKTLSVSGIFKDSTVERRQANHRSPQLNTRNDIITSYSFFEEIERSLDEAASFLLKDSGSLAAFEAELRSEGLPEDYTVEYNTARYNEANAEIKKMSGVVSGFFAIIAFIGISIIFLVNLFALRERKYEIGVLRAIGASKGRVTVILVGEMLILSIFSVLIALIIGSLVNPRVIEFMMALEMNHELPSALKNIMSGLGKTLPLSALLELPLMSVLTVFLSGSMTISSIMRFDPIKILSERS